MKKISFLTLAGLFALSAIVFSCKSGSWNDLQYSDVSQFDWLQANVKNKSGEQVLWFQVFDQVDDKVTIDGYKNSKEKIEKYPAKIFENKWIWMMVNNRIEIRLIADDKTRDFQNTDKLKKFILSFDLAGMEKVTGPKIKGKDLEKFIPKLGKK
ncbi:MAG TPA: hypothetical protein PKN50_16075 [Spirochaetota bacterium]|nr:hypothetical protein [Spirochaetota bacterium]HPV41192.1 hypothetical protein [Spirochaetota bacterium]